jgi:DNA-directed RNA polymerase specialized sigma24 family protein
MAASEPQIPSRPVSAAYVETRRRCLGYLDRLLRDAQRAEDVFHEAWLRVLERMPRCCEREGGCDREGRCEGGRCERELEVSDEFFAQTFREAHRVRRKLSREILVPAVNEDVGVSEARATRVFRIRGHAWETGELLDLVHEELERLAEAERRILVQHYHESRGSRDMARSLGLHREALLSRIRRGRERLRRAVEQRLDERLRARAAAADRTTAGGADGPRPDGSKE